MGTARQPVVISAGVVAFNERERLAASVHSLLGQALPPDARWGRLWIVSSGSTDGTAEVAGELARADPRIRVIVEPRRRGKSAAIAEVLRQATGDFLVLLNADAVAEAGSLVALLRAAAGHTPPFAVMGRPVPGAPDGELGGASGLLWELHHRLHLEAIGGGRGGTHLSDELLLLPLTSPPPLAEGIVNDGAFVGAWLTGSSGARLYAPGAVVRVDVPQTWADHVLQRRRILEGHRQIRDSVGIAPTTLPELTRQHPRAAWRVLREAIRARPRGVQEFVRLASAEARAWALAMVDRLQHRDHVLWERISPTNGTAAGAARTAGSRRPSIPDE